MVVIFKQTNNVIKSLFHTQSVISIVIWMQVSYPPNYKFNNDNEKNNLLYMIYQLPFKIALAFFFFSFITPNSISNYSRTIDFKDSKIDNYTIQGLLDHISPLNQQIFSTIEFYPEIDDTISGGLYIGCFKNGIYEFNYTGLIPETPINKKILLFQNNVLHFDTINITIRISKIPKNVQTVTLTWTTYNKTFVIMNTLIKFTEFLTIILLFVLLFKNSKKKTQFSYEQVLSLLFLLTSIGFIADPCHFIGLFISNPLIKLISAILRDLFFSYVYFYFLSQFTIMIRSHRFSHFNSFLMPYTFFNASVLYLIRNDWYYKESGLPQILPKEFSIPSLQYLTKSHLFIFTVFVFICLVEILYFLLNYGFSNSINLMKYLPEFIISCLAIIFYFIHSLYRVPYLLSLSEKLFLLSIFTIFNLEYNCSRIDS
ncbi:hypothetical protein TRFO_31908 [Tritrichomonas foetus]|uniref:Uncharacterized protein n=1 Tax=Tritrichomonas foetus TaxID=1144522 RepID=A0A1J4JQG4_9EUKA|nr:hypothetical protein TRFO_31908 [Tritrichomonas foetus]|eukprot:OHT01283.1 hypothetical protein TRFO_31908 [Tritrichomonas foetus]